ncbi:MAG: nucleotidyltransferase domain-containing protein [Candidatus Firestonebacteria bacterium]|nr:nucleotidyltransferase domain-containing protein [Candidatus Firestonebacteria bacterium]
MKKEQLIFILESYFKEKSINYNINLVFLYGSYARGYPKEESDVDLAIYFWPETSSDDVIFKNITDISFVLSEKINKDINIIPLYSDFRKPMLYYNAIVLGSPIYIKNFNQYVYLKNQAIVQMEDFSIFGTKWQLEIIGKNLEALHG